MATTAFGPGYCTRYTKRPPPDPWPPGIAFRIHGIRVGLDCIGAHETLPSEFCSSGKRPPS
jgi:hypothetical protein